MTSLHHPSVYAVIMLFAGIGIPIAAALSATLGGKLENPFLAACILFFIAFLASAIIVLMTQGIPSFHEIMHSSNSQRIPIHFYLGGIFILFYILSITWIGPRFGIGNAIALVLLGQLISMTVIDHFSLFNALNYPISLKRIIGLSFMALGIFLVVLK